MPTSSSSSIGLGQEALGLGRPQRAATHIRDALRLWRGEPFADPDGVDPPAVGGCPTRGGAARRTRSADGGGAGLGSTPGDRRRTGGADGRASVPGTLLRRADGGPLPVRAAGRRPRGVRAGPGASGRRVGLDPGPELQALAQSVLRQDPVLLGEAEVPPPPHPATRQRPRSRRADHPTPSCWRRPGPTWWAGPRSWRDSTPPGTPWSPVAARPRAAVRRGRDRQDPPHRRAGAPGGRVAGTPSWSVGVLLRHRPTTRSARRCGTSAEVESRRSPTRPRPCWPKSGRCSNGSERRRRRRQISAVRRRRTRAVLRGRLHGRPACSRRTGAPDRRQRRAHRPGQRRCCCATWSNGCRPAC